MRNRCALGFFRAPHMALLAPVSLLQFHPYRGAAGVGRCRYGLLRPSVTSNEAHDFTTCEKLYSLGWNSSLPGRVMPEGVGTTRRYNSAAITLGIQHNNAMAG